LAHPFGCGMLEDISIQFSRGQFYLVTTDDLIFVDSLHLTGVSFTHSRGFVGEASRRFITSPISRNFDGLT